MVDFDSLPDDSQSTATPSPQPSESQTTSGQPSTPLSFDTLQDDSERFGTTGEQIKAGLEGVAKGVAGPLAPLAETKLFGVKPEDIRGREDANPITSGLGQAAGLGASLLTGVGEGALMAKAGEAAAGLTTAGQAAHAAQIGLEGAEAAKAASAAFQAQPLVARIGSEAVKQAAEMAVLQGGDEIAKQIVQDPEATAQTALANIGLSAALGGATGAFITGAVSPLWKATAGPKVDEFLGAMVNHFNGGSRVALPEVVEKSLKGLNIAPDPVMRAALSGDPAALSKVQELLRAQHPETVAMIKALPQEIQEKVAQSIGVPLDDVVSFSNAVDGEQLKNTAVERIEREYEPARQAMEERNAVAATIDLPDEERRTFGGKIVEEGINKVGTDSPYFENYQKFAQRVMAKDTVGGLDQLTTELRKMRSLDGNETDVWRHIRGLINDFKEEQISKAAQREAAGMVDSEILNQAERASQARAAGPEAIRASNEATAEAQTAKKAAQAEGKQIGADVINQRADQNRIYREYAQKMETLMDALGLGDFRGTETMKDKLASLTPEQLIKRFSTNGDVRLQKFLQQEFPEIAELVRQHEAKSFLSKSVYREFGRPVLDTKALNRSIATAMKGRPEYVNSILSPEALNTIHASDVLNDAISKATNFKDSGTPGGFAKIFHHAGASALGAIGWLFGHNPIGGAMIGELGQRLAVDGPQAIKLALLRQMGSTEPIEASALKSMVEMINNTYKGENALAKGAKAVFKTGAQVVTDKAMPFADRDKLDNKVSDYQKNPEKLMNIAQHSNLGTAMPQHQVALTATTAGALKYLASLKPQDQQLSPLDRPLPPSPQQVSRYYRALDIANHPNIVLQHIKDGTLQSTDMQDLKAMYPALYTNMAQKLSNEAIHAVHNEEPIPFKTRVALSLFLGTPMDSSMTPQAIMAAQPKPQQVPPSQQGVKSKKGSPAKLGKTAKMAQTASQSAESDRSDRS